MGKITKKSWAQLNEENERLLAEVKAWEETTALHEKNLDTAYVAILALQERLEEREHGVADGGIDTVCPCGGDVATGTEDTPRTAVLYQGRLYHTEGHRTAYL